MIQNEEFRSKYLNTLAKITIVTPNNTKSLKAVLILLHGSLYPEGEYSIFERIPDELHLQRLCDIYKIMIVLPFMPVNCYYISSNDFDCDSFLANELLLHLQKKYNHIPHTEIVLGGISMGGYGALLVGAHTKRFKRILSVSGAFIQNDIIIGNSEIWGRSTPDKIAESESYLRYFYPFSDLDRATERNVVMALQALSLCDNKTSFFLSCGTCDRLYNRNKSLARELKKFRFNHSFVQLEGEKHDSDCFRKGLWAGVNWLFR